MNEVRVTGELRKEIDLERMALVLLGFARSLAGRDDGDAPVEATEATHQLKPRVRRSKSQRESAA